MPEQGPFDPGQVEFVPSPQPIVFNGRSLSLKVRWIARVLGVRPLVFEVLDSADDRQGFSSPCERVRIHSVDSRLSSILPTLRFHDLVEATTSLGVLTELVKIQGAPAYFHEQTRNGVCSNRTGTLVQYYYSGGETVVVNNDGAIYYRDSEWRAFDRQRIEPEDLANLMRSLDTAGFNTFTSQKWEVGDHSIQPYIALACARFQKVLVTDHEQALAPVIPIIEKVKAKALSNTYYFLSYGEKREIKFLNWSFPQIPLDRVEDIKRKEEQRELAGRFGSQPAAGEVAALHQQLPPRILDKLPLLYTPQHPDDDPNRDVYFRDGGKIYRVVRLPNGRPPGTVYSLRVQETFLAEAALALIAPRPGDHTYYFASTPGGFIWPEGMSVELRQVPPKGQAVTNEEYSSHELLYSTLLHNGHGMPGSRGVTFIEGHFLYTDVRLTRLERDSRSTP